MRFICFCLFLLSPLLHAADDIIPSNGARYDYITYYIQVKDGGYTESAHKRLTVYNKLGEDYCTIYLFDNAFSSLKDVKIRVYDNNGELLYEKNKDDMYKACGYDNIAIYNDDCTYYIRTEAPRFPYSIEYSYTKTYTTLFFLQGVTFQFNIPVDSFTYDLKIPDVMDIKSKMYVFDTQPVISTTGDYTTYHWELTEIPPYNVVDYEPSDELVRGKLDLMPGNIMMGGYYIPSSTWSGIGLWCQDLYRDRYTASFTSSVENPDSLIKTIYDDVTKKVRYVAIEIGVGGWQPYKADLTESRGFGDCKDMSSLLISYLRNNHIKAYPVLVLTKDEGRIDPDFPQLRFNHVITIAVNGSDTIWMDPTCELCPYGDLPTADEDIDVLVVNSNGGVLRRTPKSKPDENKIARNIKIFLDKYLIVHIDCQYTFIGNRARRLRYYLRSSDNDDKTEYMKTFLPGADKKYKDFSYTVQNLEDKYKPLIVNLKAVSKKRTDKIGNKIYLDPFIFSKRQLWESTDLNDREYSFNLSYPFLTTDTVFVAFDSVFAADSLLLPQGDSVINDVGQFTCKTDRIDDQIVLHISKSYDLYKIPPDLFPQFSALSDKIKQVTSQYIKIIHDNN